MRGKIYMSGMLISGTLTAIGTFIGFGQWAGWLSQDMYQPFTVVGGGGSTITYVYDSAGLKTATLIGQVSVFGDPVPVRPSGWVIVGWAAAICLIITTCLWLIQRRAAKAPELAATVVTGDSAIDGEIYRRGKVVTAYTYDDHGEQVGKPVATTYDDNGEQVGEPVVVTTNSVEHSEEVSQHR